MISIVARMILRDKTTPTLTTPLIRSNMSCAGRYHLSSLAFSSSISTANLSRAGVDSPTSLTLARPYFRGALIIGGCGITGQNPTKLMDGLFNYSLD